MQRAERLKATEKTQYKRKWVDRIRKHKRGKVVVGKKGQAKRQFLLYNKGDNSLKVDYMERKEIKTLLVTNRILKNGEKLQAESC